VAALETDYFMDVKLKTEAMLRIFALACATLLLSACVSAWTGRFDTPEAQAALRRAVPAEDGRIEGVAPASFINATAAPTVAEAVLLGARADIDPFLVVVTERSLLAARWDSRARGYVVHTRLPIESVTDAWLQPTVGTHVTLELKASHWRLAALGRSADRARVRINGLNSDTGFGESRHSIVIYAALARRLHALRPGWVPRPIPPTAEPVLRSLAASPAV
jgi:hypothetical protein